MSHPSHAPLGPILRLLASPPARVLMALNGDVMISYAGEPIKAVTLVMSVKRGAGRAAGVEAGGVKRCGPFVNPHGFGVSARAQHTRPHQRGTAREPRVQARR